MADKHTLTKIARHFATALIPLKEALRSEDDFVAFMYRLGWNVNSIPSSYLTIGNKITEAFSDLQALSDNPDIQEVIDLVSKLKAIYVLVKDIDEAPAGVDATAFLADVPQRLVEMMLISYLAASLGIVYNFLQLTGVIKHTQIPSTDQRPSYVSSRIIWSQIPEIIKHPETLPEKLKARELAPRERFLQAEFVMNRIFE